MSWVPGWSSAATAGWWSGLFFWLSIVSLLMLGITEVISHRYSERKEELLTKEHQKEKDDNNAELARLHLATAKANEETAKAQQAAEELRRKNLELERAIAPRIINSLKFAEALEGAKKAPINLVYLKESAEVFSFARQIERSLKRAGWDVSEPKPLSPKEMSELGGEWPGQKAQVPIPGLRLILRLTVPNPTMEQMIQLMHEPELEALQRAFHAGLEPEGRGFVGFVSIPVGAASLWQPNAPAPGEIQIVVGPKL